MNELEAYRKWHAQERAIQTFKRKLNEIELTLHGMEIDLLNDAVEQYAHDVAFMRALDRFTGHTQYGWETACGVDGRLIKMCRKIGWPRMWKLIKEIRRYYGGT